MFELFIYDRNLNATVQTKNFKLMKNAVAWVENYILLSESKDSWEDRSDKVYRPNLDEIRLWVNLSANTIIRIEPIVWSD